MDWDDLFNEPDSPAAKEVKAPATPPTPAPKPKMTVEEALADLLADEPAKG